MTNAINWFEIPVTDFERAKKFYGKILENEIQEIPMPKGKLGMFPINIEKNGIGGAIIQMEGAQPSANGTVVYLNGGENLELPLSRVEAAGGKIVMPKTSIGEHGFMAQFMDTEGNKVAFHSMK